MITLDQAKQHLRVENSEEDDYIQSLIDGALAFMAKDLNRPLYATAEEIQEEDENAIVMTKDLDQAMLLLIGGWYATRESIEPNTYAEVPNGYWRLAQHYRIYGV